VQIGFTKSNIGLIRAERLNRWNVIRIAVQYARVNRHCVG